MEGRKCQEGQRGGRRTPPESRRWGLGARLEWPQAFEMSVLLSHPSFALKILTEGPGQSLSLPRGELGGLAVTWQGRGNQERGTLAPDLGLQGAGQPQGKKIVSGLVRCNQARRSLQGAGPGCAWQVTVISSQRAGLIGQTLPQGDCLPATARVATRVRVPLRWLCASAGYSWSCGERDS